MLRGRVTIYSNNQLSWTSMRIPWHWVGGRKLPTPSNSSGQVPSKEFATLRIIGFLDRISWALIILPRYNLYKFCPALLMKFPDRPDIDPLWRKILSPVKIWTLARNDFHSSLQSRLYTLPPLLASRYLRAKHLCSRGSPITATSLCEISTSLTKAGRTVILATLAGDGNRITQRHRLFLGTWLLSP